MCLCILNDLLDVISKKWNLIILEETALQIKIRYKDLFQRLEGISPSTLSSSLRELENEGLLNRKLFNEIPPRVEYSISKKGIELMEAIKPLLEWSEMNRPQEADCRCIQSINSSKVTELQNKNLNRIIEVSMCACMCLPMMAGFAIFGNPIF